MTPGTERLLRRTAARLASDMQERDRLIQQARDEGGTLRSIATAAGLTHVGVKRILER